MARTAADYPLGNHPTAKGPLEQAWTLGRTGRSDEALAIATAVHAQAKASQDAALECRSASDIAWYCLQMGKAEQGLLHARAASAIARELGHVAAEARARAYKAWLLSELGSTEEAIEESILALQLAEPAGNAEVHSLALNVVGIILWLCRQPDRAIEFCARAVAIARQGGDPVVLGWWLINLGGSQAELAYLAKDRDDLAGFEGAMRAAIDLTEEAARLLAAAGEPWGLRLCLGNLAEYNVVCQDYAAAKALLDRYAAVVGGDYKRGQEHYHYTLGQTLMHLGGLDEARDSLLRSLEIADETGSVDAVLHAAGYLADLYERQGDHARALAFHRRFHEAYVASSADRVQQQARLAEVRYEIDRLRSVADSESRRAREMADLAENLRQARIAAEQASMAKSHFLAGMSHELRTPLNAIIGFSDLMRIGVYGEIAPKRYVDYVDVIHTSAHHLLSLINDLLDISKIEAGKMDLQIRPLETASLGAAVKGLMGQLAAQKGVALELAASPDAPVVHGDERAVRQILLNLVSNAIKFTPAGGRVSVAFAKSAAPGVEIVVTDTGPGLTDEEIAVALQPYGQVRADPIMTHEGTGLGLPLAKALAELHGGDLKIVSRKGEGTTVVVHLPAAE
ncbi:MAG TPA: tetratricopeptide repeat-containing sensor histidine kinase [Dongiaceae bacterium]|nr:tetratricopeptide repeat-containing sensor histidine kinase [Dongiaceae bacterium]